MFSHLHQQTEPGRDLAQWSSHSVDRTLSLYTLLWRHWYKCGQAHTPKGPSTLSAVLVHRWLWTWTWFHSCWKRSWSTSAWRYVACSLQIAEVWTGLKAAAGNFGVNINNFFCVVFGRKCHNTHRQQPVMWSERMGRSLCFPIMLPYPGLIKILLLSFYLHNQWCSLYSLPWLAGLRCAS